MRPQWILLNTPDGPEVAKAADVISRPHRDTNLLRLSQELERMRPGCASNLLEAMPRMNPDDEIRARLLLVATMRKSQADFAATSRRPPRPESLFQRVITGSATLKRSVSTLASLAKPELYELRHVTIGKAAPETEGEDLEGNRPEIERLTAQGGLACLLGPLAVGAPESAPLRDLQARWPANLSPSSAFIATRNRPKPGRSPNNWR